uniref:3CxxC-type domain-containing protein n=2 Tax=Schistosoma mansoni TaxID=6183 RepID=A0A5K4FBG2_SCHMA
MTNYKQHIYSIDTELHERLHIVWLGYFYELYVQPDTLYGIMWIFSPLNDLQIIKNNLIWSKKIPAKFRFHCSRCNHIWTSKKGSINIFIGHHPLNRIINQSGYIINIYEFLFSLDQQKCIQCNSNNLISGSTYPHEVIKVLTYVRNHITIRPIYFNAPQYGYQIEFLKTLFTSNQQRSENKETIVFIDSQIRSNDNSETFKEIYPMETDKFINSLKQPSENSKSIKSPKNDPLNEESVNYNQKRNNSTENQSHPSTNTEEKSSEQLTQDNNEEVIMTGNKLNNMTKNDADPLLKKETVSLKFPPEPTQIESTTFNKLKQFGNHKIHKKKMSIRTSRYI